MPASLWGHGKCVVFCLISRLRKWFIGINSKLNSATSDRRLFSVSEDWGLSNHKRIVQNLPWKVYKNVTILGEIKNKINFIIMKKHLGKYFISHDVFSFDRIYEVISRKTLSYLRNARENEYLYTYARKSHETYFKKSFSRQVIYLHKIKQNL